MSNYLGIQKEETLKAHVFADYFDKTKFAYDPNIGNIDFIVTDAELSMGCLVKVHYLWAEAKKGSHDVFDMFTQLLLTCKKTYEKGDHLAPPWLGVFDTARIAFVAFHDVLPIFNEIDFNWNQTPSNHDTEDFKKARRTVENVIGAKIIIFNFDSDNNEIREFIKTHFIVNGNNSIKSPITKDNFVQIFIKWVKEVKPYINVAKDEWTEFRKAGIHNGDFYCADVMSSEGNTITEKLKIVLRNDNYKFQDRNAAGRLFTSDIDFTDGGTAYNRFWNKYERPPAEVYQKFIIERRDLLIPQNIREVKGSFFTPAIWADKSKDYLRYVFGDNWQNEYYIWDCAAGTGNLLAGLTNEYNVWASDIEQGNVETMRSLIDIDENLNLLDAHIFQFDFLNDSFDKLPLELKKIIEDKGKRKKLIIYINPPYAEAGSPRSVMGTGEIKTGVAKEHKTKIKYQPFIGAATNEISAQFMARVYYEIPESKLALFSKFTFVCGQHYIKFRKYFNAEYKAGFSVRANSFDNVQGNFPIGFSIWDLNGKQFPKYIDTDVLEYGTVKRYWDDFNKSINHWVRNFDNTHENNIGLLICESPDLQIIHQPYFTLDTEIRKSRQFFCNKTSLQIACIYFAVRLCIEHTWLNDRDQFLFPNDGYKTDIEFQNNCFIFTLFHGQNRISCNDGANHWIPFTEKEVGAKEKFESNFMSKFLKESGVSSRESDAVLAAGLELWRYYHAKIKNNNTASVNASFYDIREFFQGRNEKGKMNAKSSDETYNILIAKLRDAQKLLAAKIAPKVYEYGFLRG